MGLPIPSADKLATYKGTPLVSNMLEGLRTFYDGCKGPEYAPFPSAGTMMQTSMLYYIYQNQLLPMTEDGVAAFLYYNAQGAAQRPDEWNVLVTNSLISEAGQAEQRATNGGADTQAAGTLMIYYGLVWFNRLVASGRKDCWLAATGKTKDDAMREIQARADFLRNEKLPASTFSPGDEPILYVPGTAPAVATTDDPTLGGFGDAPQPSAAGTGPPSSIVRPDDRWYYADGTIRNAQGVVVGTYDPEAGNVAVAQMLTDQPANLKGTGLYLWSDGSLRFIDGTVANNAQASPQPVDMGALPYPNNMTVEDSGKPMPVQVVPGAVNASSSAPGGSPQTADSPGPVTQQVSGPTGGALAQLNAQVMGVPVWAIAGAVLAAVIYFSKKGR